MKDYLRWLLFLLLVISLSALLAFCAVPTSTPPPPVPTSATGRTQALDGLVSRVVDREYGYVCYYLSYGANQLSCFPLED